MFFTDDSLLLNFGRLTLPNKAENNLINSVYKGFRYELTVFQSGAIGKAKGTFSFLDDNFR